MSREFAIGRAPRSYGAAKSVGGSVGLRLVVTLVSCAGIQGCAATDISDLPELPPGQLVSVSGETIFVRQRGVGPDIILLHGLGDSSVGWQFLEEPLVELGYRVTVWDALGAGRSSKPIDGDYSIDAHLRRLKAVVDQLDIEKATVVGHSLGGSLALVFARTCPERVSALCLIDPAAYRQGALDGRWFWNVPLLAEIVLGVISTDALVDFGMKQNFFDHARIPEDLRKQYIREARREGVITALINQERQVIPEDPDDWEAGHRRIKAPILVLWGANDALVPLAQGRRLAMEVGDVELVVLPELAHSPQLEDPGVVLMHLLSFLDHRVQPVVTQTHGPRRLAGRRSVRSMWRERR